MCAILTLLVVVAELVEPLQRVYTYGLDGSQVYLSMGPGDQEIVWHRLYIYRTRCIYFEILRTDTLPFHQPRNTCTHLLHHKSTISSPHCKR